MNLLNAEVTKVLSEPKFVGLFASEGLTWWQVEVEYTCYGVPGKTNLTFQSEEAANEVNPGYTFLT